PLHSVLEAPEERVRRRQRAGLAIGDEPATLQARKRRDGAARAHDRLFPAPHELQRLDEELRFPNAAGPELEIALGRLRELAPRALEQIGEAEGEAGLDRVAVDEGREDLALDERAERA